MAICMALLTLYLHRRLCSNQRKHSEADNINSDFLLGALTKKKKKKVQHKFNQV